MHSARHFVDGVTVQKQQVFRYAGHFKELLRTAQPTFLSFSPDAKCRISQLKIMLLLTQFQHFICRNLILQLHQIHLELHIFCRARQGNIVI